MSLPPPPDSFGPQPPTSGGQPAGGVPQHWAPQQSAGPAGPPQGGAPSWGPQQQWPGQQWPGSPPPQGGGGKTKWILGIIAVVLAIALAVVITVVLVRPDNSGNGAANAGSSGAESEFASANDTGPVNIITDDTTCDAWNTIVGKSTEVAESVNWADRDYKLPASSWTPEQRAMFDSMGKALTQAADQAVNLAKKTPNRVMRILYEQFIAYSRAFDESIPTYNGEGDDLLVAASNGASNGLTYICAAITYRVAQATSPLVPGGSRPSTIAVPGNPTAARKLLEEPNSICAEWKSLASKFDDDTESWRLIDKNIPAKEWTPEQKALNDAIVPTMLTNADEMERLGRKSGNPALEDVATLGAQYRRAFAQTIPDYKPADGYLLLTATGLTLLINAACKATT
ncbi:proline-rich domain-containing protein [Mycolicibacterium peregrinum]|uniref:proline-rich domain-containing protein n=1 Tax=Mycolicibacterium peregrinum TaxID=43304 RepID=UPI003AAAFE0F